MAIRIVPKPEAAVVHAPTVVHKAEPAVVHKKHGEYRYLNPDARREYRRKWMRTMRSKVKPADG